MVVVENTKDVTKDYLKASLEYHYRGKGFVFSDDLLTQLLSSFKKKAKNLDYIFKGKTRVALTPTSEVIFENILKNDKIKDFVNVLIAIGATVTPDDFVHGYVLYEKQKLKLAKAKSTLLVDDTLNSGVHTLSSELISQYTKSSLAPTKNKYRDFDSPAQANVIDPFGDIVSNTNRLVVSVYPKEAIKLTWKNLNYFDTGSITAGMSTKDIVLSLDINDYITCSSGSISSCMGFQGSHHLGWMMHFRSDFSVITYAHNGEHFHKTGRSWLFLKLTEDCLPYPRPFYKLSKIYGSLNEGHISMLDNYIQKQTKDILGLKKPTARFRDISWSNGIKRLVSPNMRNSRAGADVTGTGYFDWDMHQAIAFWEYKGDFPVTPFTEDNYRTGPSCILNFPDALNLDGSPTNHGHFTGHNGHEGMSFIGWNEKYKQFVQCASTGERVLLVDAIAMPDGTFLSKDVAIAMLSGKKIIKTEAVTVEAITAPEVTLDVDVEDF